MKRGEATPSRTPILRRLSTKILSYRFARTINSSFIARDPYGVSIRTWSFSTATKWFKNIRLYIYTLCIICLHTPPCRFNLLTFPRGRDGAAFIFFFFFFLLYLSLSSLSSRSSTILRRLFSIAASLIFSLLKSCTCTPVVRIKREREGEGDGYIQTSRGCKFAWQTLSGDRG